MFSFRSHSTPGNSPQKCAKHSTGEVEVDGCWLLKEDGRRGATRTIYPQLCNLPCHLRKTSRRRGHGSKGSSIFAVHASIPLSELTGMEIYCKLDHLQRTGSFKERGARNALAHSRPSTRSAV